MDLKDVYQSAFSQMQMHDTLNAQVIMQLARERKEKRKRSMILISVMVVSLLLISNLVSYMAVGAPWITRIYKGEESLETYSIIQKDDKKIYIYDNKGSYNLFENGRIYFVHNEIKQDITEACEDGNYFQATIKESDGLTRVVIIGAPTEEEIYQLTRQHREELHDQPYYVEIIYDENGEWLTTGAHGTGENPMNPYAELPEWYLKAAEVYTEEIGRFIFSSGGDGMD